MSEADIARIFVYSHVATTGTPPSSAAIAEHLGVSVARARAVVAELGATKRVVLDRPSGEIWMAPPFSAVPTRFRVTGATTSWWANCAWDMLGIPAFLREPVRIEATCPDCDESIGIDVDAEAGPRVNEGLVHFLVPARRWYEDIGFT